MKFFITIIIALTSLLAINLHAQQDVGADSIDAAVTYYTVHLDSTQVRNSVGNLEWRYDSAMYDDGRYAPRAKRVYPVQLEILSPIPDTILVRKLFVFRNTLGLYDTALAVSPILDMLSNTVDTVYLIDTGPVTTARGDSYYTGTATLYDSFAGLAGWRIERQSGKGHPLLPDDSRTHVLRIKIRRGM